VSQTKDGIELNRYEDVICYVIGLCDQLSEKGILEGGKFRLGANGREHFAALKLRGFRPTDEEIRQAFHTLQTYQP